MELWVRNYFQYYFRIIFSIISETSTDQIKTEYFDVGKPSERSFLRRFEKKEIRTKVYFKITPDS